MITIYLYLGVSFYINSKQMSLGTFINPLPIVFFILLNNEIQSKIITFITKAYSILLLISLSIWILLLVGVNLPGGKLISYDAWSAYEYKNYYLCLQNTKIYLFRFNSIFLEPGHTGLVAAFLLFINRLNFRNKYLWPIFLALIFTLSLAGYVLLLISILLYSTLIAKGGVRNIIILSFVFFGLFLFFINYNNGDNYVNNHILTRLQFVDGNIAGNNRTGSEMDRYFSRFVESSNFLFGIGPEAYEKTGLMVGNSGYKVFFIINGLIGVILTFILYLFFSLNKSSRESYLLLALYCVNFIQRANPFWSILVLIFIGGISLMNEKKSLDISYV
ncbi:MAG: hypothetical protein FWH18_08810 [Marinilabiliaceae bacterium]|nr:hypothetical protein [Marinilabiliaceae bacterium]